MTLISRRISSIILRILHTRLTAAAELESHSLLLECFHPSAKLFEPPYFCAYLGTNGLSTFDTPDESVKSIGLQLGEMRNMYSRFRPHQRELEVSGRRVKARPGDIPGSRTFPGTARDNFDGETVKQVLTLEPHELFTQLMAQTNLVKIGPRNGLFTCFVEVEEGVLRVWKDWLGNTAAKDRQAAQTAEAKAPKAKTEHAGLEIQAFSDVNDSHILWVSSSKNTGIRFNVKERKFRRDVPILIRADEDLPVSYDIEFDGTFSMHCLVANTYIAAELFIRTSHLLLMLEKSLVQEDNSSGKAIVFGSFG